MSRAPSGEVEVRLATAAEAPLVASILAEVDAWVAALGMSLSSIAVVLNAARLLPRAHTRDGIPGTTQAVLS